MREAQRHLRRSGLELSLAVCDAQSLPFDEESFDAVVANHMLYYVPDRQRAYSEIRRVLKPLGHLYATTVGAGHLRELDDLVVRVKPEALTTRTEHHVLFGLETGSDQLASWFAGVEVRCIDGQLMVTEAEPLIQYVQSYMRLNDDQASDFRKHARDQLSVNGVIPITTETGMFIAWKDGKPLLPHR